MPLTEPWISPILSNMSLGKNILELFHFYILIACLLCAHLLATQLSLMMLIIFCSEWIHKNSFKTMLDYLYFTHQTKLGRQQMST